MNLSYMNINKICRICLLECESTISIFNKLPENEDFEEISTIAEELVNITSIPILSSEALPSLICNKCIILIHAAYKFKIQFNRSHNLLQTYLLESNKTKNEATTLDSCDEDDKAVDYYIDSITQSLNDKSIEQKKRGTKRDTSQSQINKRELFIISKDVDNNKAKKRKRKVRIKSDFEDVDEDEVMEVDLFKPILHPCPICTLEFDSLGLRLHARTHKALRKYLNIGDVNASTHFYSQFNARKSVISLHNRKLKMHKCILCNLELSAPDFRMHLQVHRNQKEYNCDQCQRVFRKLNHLNTHKVKHLKEFPFKCEICSKGFVIKTNYECHVLTHNLGQELPHECTHCLKRFSNPEHLNRHLIIHTENVSYSVKYRVCKCHHCLKTFKDRADLKEHACVPIPQTITKRYPCKICHKIFNNSSGLYNHNRNIHKLKGAKTLCSVCGNHVSNIYNHMMRHTGEKPFQCNECGKRFIGKPQLKQHLLVHSGLKPFQCTVCAKAFNNLYNLQVHERIHTGNRCHVCNVCNKGFLEKSYLKKHMNVHAKS